MALGTIGVCILNSLVRICCRDASQMTKLKISFCCVYYLTLRIHFILGTGTEIVLVVNNLGGTSNLELCIMTNAAIRYLGKPI